MRSEYGTDETRERVDTIVGRISLTDNLSSSGFATDF